MTSAARKTSDRRPAGFTLLEMVIVLALAMMVIGGAAGMMYFNRDEARLNDAMGEVEILAKRARTMASLQQRPYALEFSADGVSMMPYGEALMDPNDRQYLADSQDFEAELVEEGQAQPQRSIRASYMPEDDMQMLVRRWATGDWEVITRNVRHVWRFDPQGICEPVGVRFEMENGNWIAGLFHPLTASLTEVESEIR